MGDGDGAHCCRSGLGGSSSGRAWVHGVKVRAMGLWGYGVRVRVRVRERVHMEYVVLTGRVG